MSILRKYIPYAFVRSTKTNLLGSDFDLKEYIKDATQEFLTNGDIVLPPIAVSTGTMTDADGAAATGVAIYLHMDEKAEGGSIIGHLEFVSPTNASTSFNIGNGGPNIRVLDDDAAATGGFQVYFDEDATDADSKFLVASPTLNDVFVLASNGKFLRLKYHATPATPGVAIYLDEDAASAHLKLLFVSPTNASTTYTTDDTITLNRQ